MKGKIIPVNHLDLNELSSLKTERVYIEDTEFTIVKGNLQLAIFHVKVDIWGQSNRRRHIPRDIRFSCAGEGYLSTKLGDFITFPLTSRTIKEIEALNEFCLLLQDKLGLNKEFVPEHEQEPDDYEKALRDLRAERDKVWSLELKIKQQQEQIERIQKNLKKAGEIE